MKARYVFLASFLLLALPWALAAQVPLGRLASALRWRSIGPYTGGRVTSVAGIASEPNVYFMGTAGGGVWESTDYGHSWKPVMEKYLLPGSTGSIGALAIAPSNPDIIYVGSGDSAPRNTVLTGDGMYKSADGGKTWTHIGLTQTHIITWILVDPQDPNTVYVAALGHLFGPNPQRGVFKTSDGGQTWKKILYVNDHTGAITMAMDPSNPQVVYAAMWQMRRRHWGFSSGGPGSGIYKTTDGGATWTNISHRPGLPAGIFGKVGLAVAPSDPSVVYALIQARYKGQAGALFRSDDAGQTWHFVTNNMNITQRAFYYSRVYVDPKDPNTIYLPNAPVYVSRDGGKTLIALHPPHGDNHAFWINPDHPQFLIEGNDGGATVSLNGGKSWSSESNQPTGQFYHADLDQQFPFHVYGAQQDRDPVEGPSAVAAGGIPAVWTHLQGAEMTWLVPQPGAPWITYGSGFYDQEWKQNRRTHMIFNVSPWAEYKFGHAGDHIQYRNGWIHHPVVFSPHNPQELLLGANVVWKTLDGGIHWNAISPDLTRDDKAKLGRPGGPISADVTGEEMFDSLTSIAFSPLADNVIWTGSDDGLVYLTTDAGSHWTPVRPPQLPTWSTITCIEPSHNRPGTAYVSASRFEWDDFHPYIYKTTDYGKTWTPITTGLPSDEYVESVRQDPDDPSLLLAGTSATVYFSLDGGAQWQPLRLNLPVVRVMDIEFQTAQHAVVIATFGRAFWILDNPQFLEQLGSAQVTSDAPYLFRPQQTWLLTRRLSGYGASGGAGQNLPSGAAIFFHLPSNYDGSPIQLTFTTAGGARVNRLTLPAAKAKKLHAGMNRFLWNLRYPTATEIKGAFHSGFGASVPTGPKVMPGAYYVSLTYAGTTTPKQLLVVKLDPRIHTTQAGLQQRFDLLMRIHQATNRLDLSVNQAVAARDALKNASGAQAQAARAKLNHDINDLVDFKIQSGEGALVYPPLLRGWLSSIANQVSMNFVAPTPAMVQAANLYIAQARAGSARLRADDAAARQAQTN